MVRRISFLKLSFGLTDLATRSARGGFQVNGILRQHFNQIAYTVKGAMPRTHQKENMPERITLA
jgi:hypothetical protein